MLAKDPATSTGREPVDRVGRWFAGADEPIATLDELTARPAVDQIRAILGP
ncbi:hypothetical protein OIE68_42880 [Nocardia vinacea]|uniref:Uncharacterized protein n=1 Tax=Nocardia vinacea TaxID=96468 RepID=A0ABZ1YJI8_9NOCA|nr:hypothetical protein OIE68_42880 [Nocardia vinacea]